MNNAADTQVYTGPSASFVHHSVAFVQDTFGIDSVASLGVFLVFSLITAIIVVGVGAAVVDRLHSGH